MKYLEIRVSLWLWRFFGPWVCHITIGAGLLPCWWMESWRDMTPQARASIFYLSTNIVFSLEPPTRRANFENSTSPARFRSQSSKTLRLPNWKVDATSWLVALNLISNHLTPFSILIPPSTTCGLQAALDMIWRSNPLCYLNLPDSRSISPKLPSSQVSESKSQVA